MSSRLENDFVLLTGTAHPELAQKVGAELNKKVHCAVLDSFKDGEVQVQIPDNVRRRHVYVIQPTCRPDPNRAVIELELMINAASLASADEITAVIPYFGYGRQDRKDQPRVPISGAWTAQKLAYAGANRFLTVDLHNEALEGAVTGVPWDNVYASYCLIPAIQELKLSNLTIVSPDAGGLKRARKVSTLLGLGIHVPTADKYRPSDVKDAIETTTINGDLRGKDVLFYDDIINTASTIAEPAKIAREMGAKSVRAAAAHALLVGDAQRIIENSAFDEVLVTDTVPLTNWAKYSPRVRVISVARLLAGAISRIESGESISNEYILHSHLDGDQLK